MQWAPRSSPYLAGLHSIQASSNNSRLPDITTFSIEADASERWMESMARRNVYDAFFYRRDAQSVDLHARDGKFVKKMTAPSFVALAASEEVRKLSRDAMLHSAREAIRNPNVTLLVCAEDHAGASAADHSNFVVICRRMLLEAASRDLAQFSMLEHKTWPCRVTSLYADISALSTDMQNTFLERYKWLSNSWPLNARHHADTLAARFVNARSTYVTGLLLDCGHAAGMSWDEVTSMQARWMLASPGVKYQFAQHIVESLQEGLIYSTAEAELFCSSHVKNNGSTLARNHRAILA